MSATSCARLAALAAAANGTPAPPPPSDINGRQPPACAAAAKRAIPFAPRLAIALLVSSVAYGLCADGAAGARAPTNEIAAWVMSCQAIRSSGYWLVCQTAQ